ncbi:tyrosine--tRNA ligase [Streptococcus pneumoniae]|uniref:tyrosine--tRNA ligase n=1 Tax=Streptococcus pneumoniae TaxID=1313 RepID=UPI0031CCD5E3|nr:tyrosine--tRNA ligase [Streptococcus pneumoniae]MDG9575130.1 tyrosine--tRNA ligase [Streptococcus pneumoniae]
MKLFEDLQWRGLVKQYSSDSLIEKLNNGKLTFYIGTDPTADSLHLGHYSSFLIAKRLAKYGHQPIILIGGATALVGDPRGTSERDLAEQEKIFNNFEKLKNQIQKIFPYEIVNNYDWTKNIMAIDFLREFGKHITAGYMSNKELVKRQMTTGISFTEFSYMLLQGMDFYHLFTTRGVTLQIAGSDQWGNMTTGIDLVRKKTGEEVFAMTMPLITDEKGKKFGKSEGNAIWISENKTTPEELHNFLLNVSDDIVISLLKKLTFLSRKDIEEIESKHKNGTGYAQGILADTVTFDIHGVSINKK